jgi:hypothetical protein
MPNMDMLEIGMASEGNINLLDNGMYRVFDCKYVWWSTTWEDLHAIDGSLEFQKAARKDESKWCIYIVSISSHMVK